jgi:hypothetical protein
MGWSPQIHAGFLGPRVTWDDKRRLRAFRVRGCYPLRPAFPEPFHYTATCNSVTHQVLDLLVPLPRVSNATWLDTDTVWPLPSSLAATEGVAVAFLSSGY